MKIAIDISQVIFKGSGVATYTENLVENIAKQDTKNQYLLFGSSLRGADKLKKFCESFKDCPNFKYKIFNFPPSFLNILWNRLHVFSIERLIGKVDILHTSDWLEPPSSAKKITTIHDMVVFTNPEAVEKKIVKTQRQKLFWVAKESKKIISVSQSTKKDIENYLKIPEENTAVIYEAAENNYKKTTDKTILSDIKEKYSLPQNFFLVVGASQKRKNIRRILEAMEIFRAVKKDFRLVIVGNTLEVITAPDSVNLGFVSKANLQALYSLASALVFVPTYEGFGLPILEALSCGCQVVSSNTSSMPEVGGDAVFYVDPYSPKDIAEKMIQAVTSPKENSLLLNQANKFSWEKAAKETIILYESLT